MLLQMRGRKIPWRRRLFRAPLQCGLRQAVGLDIILTGDVRDREFQGARQFAAGPMQRIKTRAAADVFARHLPNYNLRIGVNVQLLRSQRNRALQRLHERGVFGHIVILVANPLGDADRSGLAAADDHTNPRGPRISQAAAIYVRHQIRHHLSLCNAVQN
jgi:hypothetical protein